MFLLAAECVQLRCYSTASTDNWKPVHNRSSSSGTYIRLHSQYNAIEILNKTNKQIEKQGFSKRLKSNNVEVKLDWDYIENNNNGFWGYFFEHPVLWKAFRDMVGCKD